MNENEITCSTMIYECDIVDLQQSSEPHLHKGRPINNTMHDRHKIEFLYMKSFFTLNQGISDMSCNCKLIFEVVRLNF